MLFALQRECTRKYTIWQYNYLFIFAFRSSRILFLFAEKRLKKFKWLYPCRLVVNQTSETYLEEALPELETAGIGVYLPLVVASSPLGTGWWPSVPLEPWLGSWVFLLALSTTALQNTSCRYFQMILNLSKKAHCEAGWVQLHGEAVGITVSRICLEKFNAIAVITSSGTFFFFSHYS